MLMVMMLQPCGAYGYGFHAEEKYHVGLSCLLKKTTSRGMVFIVSSNEGVNRCLSPGENPLEAYAAYPTTSDRRPIVPLCSSLLPVNPRP